MDGKFYFFYYVLCLVQTALSGLQHHLGLVIKKQAEKTDETIRIFTDQQYEKLTTFQNRAMQDHSTLVRCVLTNSLSTSLV